MSQVPTVALRDGTSIPQLGFGVWQLGEAECVKLVVEALRIGYRSIDTAQLYGNEASVGQALRETDVPRSTITVTSKLRNAAHKRDDALRAFDLTMDNLGLDQLDHFLIHWPVPEQDLYVEAWTTLIELQAQGRVRSIGVSNFDQGHVERIVAATGVVPVVNQIELHPRFQQLAAQEFHQRLGIVTESWSPLGPGTDAVAFWEKSGLPRGEPVLSDGAMKAIATKHGKTPAQVAIRWQIQQGLVLFPKSAKPERIAENFDVFDFTLDDVDLKAISVMDRKDGKIGAQPANFNMVF